MESEVTHRTILEVIQTIPPGHVMTYGEVAKAAGVPRRARLVGRLLRDLPDGSDIPWHRVVNARGMISERGDAAVARQRRLLEGEGINFDDAGRIDLELHRYVRKRRRSGGPRSPNAASRLERRRRS